MLKRIAAAVVAVFVSTAAFGQSPSAPGYGPAPFSTLPGINAQNAASNGGVCANCTPAPNLLVNPSMDIDQANEGASIAITNAGGDVNLIDQWIAFASSTASNLSAAQVTDAPPGFSHSLKFTVGTGASLGGSDLVVIKQNIEANQATNIAFGTSRAATLSVSFWLKASVAGVYGYTLYNPNAARSYIQACTVAAATWTQCSAIIPGDTGGTWTLTGTGPGIQLSVTAAAALNSTGGVWASTPRFATSAQTQLTTTTNATLQITGAKLEISAVPTPFVRRDFAAELGLAERYYEKNYDIGTALGTVTTTGSWFFATTSASSISAPIVFKATKRCDPTMTAYSPATGTAGKAHDYINNAEITPTVDLQGNAGARFSGAPSTGTAVNIGVNWSASCRL